MQINPVSYKYSCHNNIASAKTKKESVNSNMTSFPHFADAKSLVNVNFKARRMQPNLSVVERRQFFNRIETVNFFKNTGDDNKIAAELKSKIKTRLANGSANDVAIYLRNTGRTLIEVSYGNFMVLLNQDELLPVMDMEGMNYYLSFPNFMLSADSQFCKMYPFYDEKEIYEAPDANPVINEHPKYLYIYGEGYAYYNKDFEGLRLCEKIWKKSANFYLSDIDYYFGQVAENQQFHKPLMQDINGIYYKKLEINELPRDLRDQLIYINLKDGSLHASSSDVFKITPREPYDPYGWRGNNFD